MTWTNYQQYLEDQILQKKEELEEEEETENEDDNQDSDEENNKESPYTLRPSAKTKYNISKEQELITVLSNLIQSIENNEEINYHPLPELTDLLDENNKLKTWNQLFPKREEVHFGKKEEIEAQISKPIWTILGKIFTDYAQTATRKQRLEDFANEDQMMSKILLEGLARLNANSLKKQGFDIQLKNWLKEYQELETSEQQALEKQKKQIETILKTLEETKEEKEEVKSWYHNIPWKKVLWYGGGGLLVIIVISYLWRKLQE